MGSDLRFHHLHGRNARIIRAGLVAQRPNANGEFNDAIVMSNRQLHDGEMFEVMIEKMVNRWSGSLEAGEQGVLKEGIKSRRVETISPKKYHSSVKYSKIVVSLTAFVLLKV